MNYRFEIEKLLDNVSEDVLRSIYHFLKGFLGA